MTSFTKMHGISNDFVVVDQLPPSEAWIRAVCDRRSGVGADGVLCVTLVEEGVLRMQYWNADGSPAEMCGNGLRCTAKYGFDTGLVTGKRFMIDTQRGRLHAELLDAGLIRVEAGPVTVAPKLGLLGMLVTPVNVGNPHVVTFVDSVGKADVDGLGALAQDEFVGGVNVEFVERTGEGIKVRVYERGVGETLACGSGAVAAAVVSAADPQATGPITVELPGGQLTIEAKNGTSWITGPAETSFKGVLPI